MCAKYLLYYSFCYNHTIGRKNNVTFQDSNLKNLTAIWFCLVVQAWTTYRLWVKSGLQCNLFWSVCLVELYNIQLDNFDMCYIKILLRFTICSCYYCYNHISINSSRGCSQIYSNSQTLLQQNIIKQSKQEHVCRLTHYSTKMPSKQKKVCKHQQLPFALSSFNSSTSPLPLFQQFLNIFVKFCDYIAFQIIFNQGLEKLLFLCQYYKLMRLLACIWGALCLERATQVLVIHNFIFFFLRK